MSLQHQVAESKKISQALRHLLAFDQQEAGMKPEMSEGLAGVGFRLRNLVLVMREDQIFSAGVQVKSFPEFVHRHDGALEVPARASRADGRFPRSFAWLRGLPEREVASAVLIIFIDVDAGAILHAAEISFRKLAVLRKLGDAEVIRSVVGAVGETFVH